LEVLRRRVQEARDSRRRLIETADKRLRERLADLQRQLDQASNRAIRLQQAINAARSRAKCDQAGAAHTSSLLKQWELQQSAKQQLAEAAGHEKELACLRERITALGKEIETVCDAMMEP